MKFIEEINQKYCDGLVFVSTHVEDNSLIIECKHGKEIVKFKFEHYCSFMVRQEVTALDKRVRKDRNKIIVRSEKSWFINEVEKRNEFLFKPIIHYTILCEFEVIDIATYSEMVIIN